jgi:hypothetical protein
MSLRDVRNDFVMSGALIARHESLRKSEMISRAVPVKKVLLELQLSDVFPIEVIYRFNFTDND